MDTDPYPTVTWLSSVECKRDIIKVTSGFRTSNGQSEFAKHSGVHSTIMAILIIYLLQRSDKRPLSINVSLQ